METNLFSEEYFMKEALKEAHKALSLDEVPVGAVIVCNNLIIARSHNYTNRLNDATAHAEMQAFTSAFNFLSSKYLNECSLYVTLEPCVMCAGASNWSQIKRIVYGANDEIKGCTNYKNILHPKTEIIGGVLKDECSIILKEFFSEKRK